MKAAPTTCPACHAVLPAGAEPCPACGHGAGAADLFRPGDVLESRYRVDAEVGRGGMGVVYRGTDLTLKRAVAIKALRPDASDTDLLARFLREARALASVEHAGLVPVYGVGREGRVFYMVMKFVEGETLAQVLKREGRLAADRVRRLVGEACEALATLHEHGMVHRDLKPGNLILGPDGRVTVMDLGIAQSAGDASQGALGTPRYMAPEMISGREVDARADLYALGVIAYQALAGAPPFDGPTPMAVLYKAAHEQPEPLRKRAPGVPRALAAAIERALAKDPAQRWPDAGSFAAAVAAGTGKRSVVPFAVAGVVVLAGAAFALLRPAPRVVPPPPPTSAAPVSVAPPPPPTAAAPVTAPPSEAPPSVAPPSVAHKPPPVPMVRVTITSEPGGALVSEHGHRLGPTPLTIERPASTHALTFSLHHEGFTDREVSVTPEHDATVHGKLDAIFELVP